MHRLVRHYLLFVLLISPELVFADNPAVFSQTVNQPISEVYSKVYKSLEDARFFVIFEPNIGRNLSGFKDKWGADYNQNNLTAIRSMVFCNAWYANQVSNKDPDMLGLCPLHMTLAEKDGKTTALFNRPSFIARHSKAYATIVEIEQKIINAIQKGMQ